MTSSYFLLWKYLKKTMYCWKGPGYKHDDDFVSVYLEFRRMILVDISGE